MGIWYCTREDVKSALDSKATAYNNRKIDRAIEYASRNVEGLLNRVFYPEITVRKFDWPGDQRARSWRYWLESNEVISLTSLVSGGVTIPPTSYFLRRPDNVDKPPYQYIELDISTTASFNVGSTFQRSLVGAGTFGYEDTQTLITTLAGGINSSVTTLAVADSSSVGVGGLLVIGTERVIVTAKNQVTTSQTLQADLASLNNAVTVAVTTGSSYFVDEVIMINSEKMIIRDITGNNLTVERAWDGSVLAAHTASSNPTIYAPRSLTVTRGVLGTTAASHSNADSIYIQAYPGLVVSLSIAYSLNEVLQGASGYARVSGTGDHQKEFTGRGIKELEADAVQANGRKARIAMV